MQSLGYIIRVARPLFLLGAVLVFALGAGIAKYLGVTIDWRLYFLGQFWVTFMQLSVHFLNEYYDADADVENSNRTPFSGGSGEVGEDKISRSTILFVSFACLAVVASLTVLIFRQANLSPVTLLIMVLIFLGGFFYSVPPVRLVSSGYGELTTSFIVANLVPALAFVLQTGELHRLIGMSTFPLTALHLSMMLAFELPDYANDIKYEKQTLMVRIGWQRGMVLHNFFILTAYILLGLAVTFGMPLSIAGPAFFTLPLGILQIWQMRRIADGASPNWTTLTLLPVALFAGLAYLLTFAYWTN